MVVHPGQRNRPHLDATPEGLWPPLADIDGPFSLAPYPDGRKVVFGSFTHVNGFSRPGLARLKADETLDEGFVPELPPLLPWEGSRINWVTPLRSGAVLVWRENSREILRLREDGPRDTSFQLRNDSPNQVPIVEAEDGTLWFAVSYPNEDEQGVLFHLKANGAVISPNAWTPESFDPLVSTRRLTGVLPDGRLIFSNHRVCRLNGMNGGIERDPSFPSLFIQSPGAVGLVAFSLPGRPHQTLARISVVNGLPLDYSRYHALPVADFPATSLYLVPQVWPWWEENPLERRWIRKSEISVQATNTTHFRIIFRRFGPSTDTSAVHYTTRDVTATAGVDYEARSGTITFAPLEVEKAVLIPVLPGPGSWLVEEFELVVIGASGLAELPMPLRLRIGEGRWTRPRLERVKRLPDGRVLLGGVFPREGGISIQASSDLKTWQPVPVAVSSDTSSLLVGSNERRAVWPDASAINAPTRFYRVVGR